MENIIKALGDHFVFLETNSSLMPVFKNVKNGLIFQYINGGEYSMGLSEEEEESALALIDDLPFDPQVMRPVKMVRVKPLLVTRTPILSHEAKNILGDTYVDEYGLDENVVAYLNRSDAVKLAQKVSCRLPKEEEWEYLCRSGTTSLFVFGNELPNEDELDRWLDCDFSDLSQLNANPFGLYGMFNPEWCEDEFRRNYSSNAKKIKNSYVVRGGGSYFWPWQEEEWVWCMSAMRYPSKDVPDEECCLRLVYDIPQF